AADDENSTCGTSCLEGEKKSSGPPVAVKEISEDTEIGKILRRARSRKAVLTLKERELLLNYNVATLFNNNIPNVQKQRLRTGDPTKCLKERLPSKKGRFRETILGKRTNQSSRNVIN